MAETFRAEGWEQRDAELAGWPVRITSYKLQETWRCEIANVSPGATIARATSATREGAVEEASAKARERLGRQRVFDAG
jgi:hypothetical protein